MIDKHIITQDIKRAGQLWKLCARCMKRTISIEQFRCDTCTELEKQMELDTVPIPEDNNEDKLCQFCIEHNNPNPNAATKRWANDFYICLDCYTSLLDNLLSFPNHFSELITSEQILQSRDEIFNHHHAAIVNLSKDDVEQRIEDYKKILFTVRIFAEDATDYINKCKQEERAKNNLTGIEKSKKELSKKPSLSSKLGGSAEDKLKEKMAKTLGISVKALEQLGAQARVTEFQGILDGKPQSKESPKENKIDKPTTKLCPLCKVEVASDGLLKHYGVCPQRKDKV